MTHPADETTWLLPELYTSSIAENVIREAKRKESNEPTIPWGHLVCPMCNCHTYTFFERYRCGNCSWSLAIGPREDLMKYREEELAVEEFLQK